MKLIPLLFSLKGRIRRRDWWVASIALTVINPLVEFAGYVLITGKPMTSYWDSPSPSFSEAPDAYAIFSWTVTALFMWPELCVSVKRFHDRSRSGWIAVAILTVTYLVFISREGMDTHWAAYIAFAAFVVAINLWQLIECGILEGTKGPNRYGPSPKGLGSSADVF